MLNHYLKIWKAVNDIREILFRAKRLDNGEWVEGYVFDDGFIDSTRRFIGNIIISDYKGNADDKWEILGTDFYEIIPETICQFTGRYDVNKKRIWENDIVKNIIDGDIYKCAWNSYNCEYELRNEKESFGLGYINPHSYEVVGNAIDNPELLKGGSE